ncbi:MAG: haloalkane dehalogenase [Candidatus Paceibacteria bacterium]|jgi:haloalkane dehalogenase
MKKILKFLLLIIIIAVAAIWFTSQDNSEDFVAYQLYVDGLSSFETTEGTLRYSDEGSGQPILLVHGVPTNSWMYRNLSSELVDNGYRVIAPDLMGFGASDRMAAYDDYDFENQAEILIGLMESLGLNDWEQVTHDMGGLVTWNMTRLAPEKISHLYILNTILYEDTFHPPADFSYENKLHRWFLGLHAHPIVGKLIINNMLRSGTDGHDFSRSDKAGYWLPVRNGAGALVHFFTHTAKIKENIDEYRGWLVDSNISTSVIWGEDDPFLGSESVALLKSEMGLSDSDVMILIDKKHVVAEESFEEIAQFIINN